MPSLPFNFTIAETLRRKLQLILAVLPIGLMFAAFLPLWVFAKWLGGVMGIPEGAPVKEHPNGLLWLAIFLVAMVFLMVFGYVLGWAANACICRFVLGWEWQRVRSVFLLSDVPSEWLVASATGPISGSKKRESNWATVRLKGRFHYILTRGVLAWGIPMYVVMVVAPSLRADTSPTAVYFLWQAGLWGGAGALFGAVIWHFSERQFLRRSHEQRP